MYLLSNKHVLNPTNNANPGDPIVQPGVIDGGTRTIAHFSREQPLNFSGVNQIDAALAEIADSDLVSSEIIEIGVPKGTADYALRKRWVIKCGRTTGITRGYIEDANASITIPYGSNVALFDDQILIRGVPSMAELSSRLAESVLPFCASGDSGSLVIDEITGAAVGLLFASSDKINIAWANKISNVFNALRVGLAG